MPAIVSPKRTLQRCGDGCPPCEAGRVDHSAVSSEIGDVSNARRHRDRDSESDHRTHLGDGENILHGTAETDAEIVDNRQDDNHRRGQSLDAEFLERRDVADQRKVKRKAGQRSRCFRQSDEPGGVFGEDVGERRNRS